MKNEDEDGKASLCSQFWLPSFNVNGEERRHKAAFRRRTISPDDVPNFDRLYNLLRATKLPSYWIVKPQRNTYVSRGMHLSRLGASDVTSPKKFERWIEKNLLDKACWTNYDKIRCDRRKMTFQAYNHNPLLARNRKFDMRLWLLIASVDPLRVYMMRHAYPKIAPRPFDLEDLDDQCRHIRTLMDPNCDTIPDEFFAYFPHGYPKATASPVFFEALDGDESWVDKETWWNAKVWPAIELQFAKVLMLVRPSLLKLAKEAEAAELAAQPDEPHKRHRRWTLLSPDIALDQAGHVFIEEINTNGAIVGTHLRDGGFADLFHDDGYLRDMFRLLGADGHPRQARYNASLDDALDRFCRDRPEPCTAAQIAHLRLTVHEEAHAGNHWYRVFPPQPCWPDHNVEEIPHPCLPADDDDPAAAWWWPEQARLPPAMRRAMEETPADAVVRDFLATTDTAQIHGIRQVPGHARWPARSWLGVSAEP